MKLFNGCVATLFATCIVTGCTSKSSQSASDVADSKKQEVRLPLAEKALSLDPRLSSNLITSNISRMIFEGLTYIDENGKIFPGCAVNIQISPDLKTYTFKLRDTKWSNGDKVVASDFEYSWKSMLRADMKAPMAYMLFPIKGAQSYFEGRTTQDEIGIYALDDTTLVVNLENPMSYFLQLTATAAYMPVHQKWTEAHPGFKDENAMQCVSNGPFNVASFMPDQKLELVKNPNYWGHPTVKLEKAHISFMDDQAALASFRNGDLDWVGAPLSTLGEAGQAALKTTNALHFLPAAGTQFLRMNLTKAPFNDVKFRKAFSLATDTQSIVAKVMKGDQKPAGSLVPPGMGIQSRPPLYNVAEAAKLFELALLDMGMTRNDLPEITLSYVSSERMQKIAELLAQNWKTAFNIDVKLEGSVPHTFYDKFFAEEYDLAAGSWFADYYDPMSFLSVFQYKDNGTNYTGWENADYTRLLNQSNAEANPVRRMTLLQNAQNVLMDDAPILPLFHFAFSYGKNDNFEQATLSPMGMVDIDDAYFINVK